MLDDLKVTRYEDDLEVVLDAAIAIDGEDGVGVLPGGLLGQILTKASATDFDTLWANPSAGVPNDGTAGQLLSKVSSNPYDTLWIDPIDPDDFAPVVHTHLAADITDLTATLDPRYAQLGVANTFTLGQTINMGDTLPSICLTLTSTWGSASAGPFLQLSRLSPDPAALDEIGQISFIGKDSGLVDTVYASIGAIIVDPTNGSEDSKLRIRTVVGSNATTIATFETGVLVGTSTGGDKGVGTLNATALYEQGVTLTGKYAPLVHTHTLSQITDAATKADLDGVNTWSGAQTFTAAQTFFANGTQALPGITFTSDPDCGLRRSTSNGIALVTGGVDTLTIGPSTITAAKNINILLTSGDARFGAFAPIGNYKRFSGGNTSGHSCWNLDLGNTTAETGADVGSDLELQRISDASGATTTMLIYRKTGAMVYGSATGGDMGTGTINAKGFYVDGTLLTGGGGVSLSTPNTWTALQSFTTASGLGLEVISTDLGATVGPIISLKRNSTTPANDDVVAGIWFQGNDSTPTMQVYGAITAKITDITPASFDAKLQLQAAIGSTVTNILTLGPGVQVGTAADTGVNTLNAGTLYEAGVTLASKYEGLGVVAGINTQTASYTLVLTDAGKVVEVNNASANTLTIPPNSTVAFPLNTRIDVAQYGAGQTTITPGAGVTIRQREAKLKLTGQYAGASLYKRGTDEWVLFGDLAT